MDPKNFDKNYYYGGVYEDYDNFKDFETLAHEIVRDYDFDSFLDVGCGCGNLPVIIKDKLEKKLNKSCDIRGVDVSEFAVQKANLPFITLADCRNIAFDDQSFDFVHILGTFSYLDLEEAKKAVAESYRLAKKFILFDDVYSMPDPSHHDFDPFRKFALSQEEWAEVWRDIMNADDLLEFNGDQIVIRKK